MDIREAIKPENPDNWITDGKIFGKEIYPAEGLDEQSFYEITNEDYERIFGVGEEATEEDYLNALERLGVK